MSKEQKEQANQINTLLAAVTEFILNHQQKDSGAWAMNSDGHEPNSVATALAIDALLSYRPANLEMQAEAPIKNGLDYLCRTQQSTNRQQTVAGWADPRGVVSVIPTALAVFTLIHYLLWQQNQKQIDQYREAANRGLNWLMAQVDNWFTTSRQKRLSTPDVYWNCMTLKESQRIEALQSADIEWNILPPAFSLVKQHQDPKSGGWGDRPFAKGSPLSLVSTASLTYLLLKYSPDPEGAAVQNGLNYTRAGYKMLKSNGHPSVRETVRAGITLLEGDKNEPTKEIQEEVQHLITSYEAGSYGWRYSSTYPIDLRATHSVCRMLYLYQHRSTAGGEATS